ncbi:CatB-related O-acetyltransferase [Cupriavidus gilardii]|uniref:CatB-related O-acetyltransferase n=1 Tax=Cupriavidus gilardii TaxID=82541 RepID=UPI0021BFCDE4|nr:CatB-related O-acetyltransferase [Cupriavidus gilardii]MCT9114958.1 CatB-related O-acetyltransferase [Cupriavidus gilardii]MCT9123686.1 CatB-related O-acetyltransferase [Cupriavidus gilardii]
MTETNRSAQHLSLKQCLRNNSQITFEQDIFIHRSTPIIGTVVIGAYSYIGEGSLIGRCVIGRFCSIAPKVVIGLGVHPTSNVSTHPFFFASKNGFNVPDGIGTPRDLKDPKYRGPIIGHDVWIGTNVVINKGVRIGHGAIIAAGAVVTKDVAPYSIVGGCPARHIRFRFDEPTIAALTASEWWNSSLDSFVGLPTDSPLDFCRKLKQVFQQASYQTFNVTMSGTQEAERAINWNRIFQA